MTEACPVLVETYVLAESVADGDRLVQYVDKHNHSVLEIWQVNPAVVEARVFYIARNSDWVEDVCREFRGPMPEVMEHVGAWLRGLLRGRETGGETRGRQQEKA